MCRFTILLLISLITISNCISQNHTYNENIDQNGLKIIESKSDLVKLSFAIEEFELKEIIVEEILMSKIIWGSAFLPGKEGYPELPSITKNIVIPNDAEVELSFTTKSNETIDNLIIYPAAKTPGELQKSFEAHKSDCYLEDAFYPESPIQICYTEIRGLKIARVSVIPFQFNPVTKELIIHKNMDIELSINSKTQKFGKERFRSIYWDQILADVIFNFEDLPPMDYSKSKSKDDHGCELLIICPNQTEFKQWADTIKRFRNEQGISTQIYTTEQIGGNDTGILKQFIINAYESWNPVPSAILLLADHNYNSSGISSKLYSDHPEFNDYYVGDNYYGDNTNNDLPDIVIGRIPAKNEKELRIMIKKYIDYESNPPKDFSYYNNPLMGCGYQTNRWFQMCSESISGYMRQALGKEPVRIDDIVYWFTADPNTEPWSTAPNSDLPIDYFGVNGLNYIPESPAESGPWGDGTDDDIIAQLESGSFISIFRDHGGDIQYGCPEFETDDIARLDNKTLPIHLFSFACYNGAFNYGNNCLIEEFLLHNKGGIYSGTASSTWSWSFYNDCILWGTIDNLWQGFLPDNGNNNIPFREFRPAFGLAAGKYYMSNSNWIASDTFKTISNRIWHHFGDPFGIVYTSVPMNNPIQHLFSLGANTSSLEVEAEPFSLVCLSLDNEIISKSFTNNVGKTILEFNPHDLYTKFKIVITKQNYNRYEEDIYVVPEQGSYLILKEIIQIDDNNNGQVDYNESITIDLGLRNYGNSSSEATKIIFSGNEEHYNFVGELEYSLEKIPENSKVLLKNVLRFQTRNETPDQYTFNVQYEFENATLIPNSNISILVNAPDFYFFPMEFTEISGNGDGYPNPGEILDIDFKYINQGHAKYPASTIYINTPSPHITTLLSNNQIPETNINDTISLVFQIEIAVAADSHSIFQCNYRWENENLLLFNEQYFYTGKVTEDFESGNLEKFDWYFEGDKDWEIVSDYVEDGMFALKIDGLNDNEEASVNLNYYFGADYYITFSAQVSSEKDFDRLSFIVNDSLIQYWSNFLLFGYSTEQKVLVPKGYNKLTWKYSKNESTSSGLDAAWIDRIILPPIDSISNVGYQEIENAKYISISPIPANEEINMINSHNAAIELIEIIALDDRIIQSTKETILPKSQSTLNLGHLASGSYIIRFTSSNEDVFIDKLIIK